ncbi:MAG: cell division protein FtsQ/DivIB [Candidatus Comchoanobacterales bacterium]
MPIVLFLLSCSLEAGSDIYLQLNDNDFDLSDWDQQFKKLQSQDDVDAFCRLSIWQSCQIYPIGANSLLVRGRPKKPVAIWGNDYLDESGNLFYARSWHVDHDLLYVKGGVEHLHHVQQLLNVLHDVSDLKGIEISAHGQYSALTKQGVFILGSHDLVERAKRLKALLPWVDEKHFNHRVNVDLRYDHAFALRIMTDKPLEVK